MAALCSFDQSVPKISCYALGAAQGSQLRWESNVAGWATDPSYEFELVQAHQLVPQVVVTLQACQGSSCETVEAILDTSSITPESTQESDSAMVDESQEGLGSNGGLQDYGPSEPATTADLVRQRWSTPNECEGEGSQMLAVAPIAPDQLDFIDPLGALSGVHPTPVSHQYFYPLGDVVADVRAPTSGIIVNLTNRGSAASGSDQGIDADLLAGRDYEVQYTIEISCDLYLIVDHVHDVSDVVRLALSDQVWINVRIAVSEGELLGRQADGYKVDLSVIDLSRGEVDGFVRKDSYFQGQYGEVFKLFERDSLEYFDDPLGALLTEKSLRTVPPRGGTFIYDVVGTAQGSWFQEGTNWFAGNLDNPLLSNWAGHLALIPNNIDPSKLRVAIGDGFQGLQMASVWGVTGDTPTFDSVTPASGPTTYELRHLFPCDGSSWSTVTYRSRAYLCNEATIGMLVVELLDNETMRLEVFFGDSPEGGLAFTDNARIYVR